MEGVLESNRPGNIRHAKVLIPEEMGGAMHAGLENILHGGHAKVVAEQFGDWNREAPASLAMPATERTDAGSLSTRKSIDFDPTFIGESLECTVPTPLGPIRSSWKRTGENYNVKLQLPKGTTATPKRPAKPHEHSDCGLFMPRIKRHREEPKGSEMHQFLAARWQQEPS